MTRLDNKIAIVTGGAGGIGSGIVRAYVKENAKVVIADIAEEKGRTLSTELNKQGYETLFIKTDLSNKESLKSCVDQTIQTYGQIDILINNAHASRMNNFLDITEEDLDLSFNTGFYATFYLCQMVIPHLKETQGNIINFGSGAAVKGDKNQGSYVVAKEAIRGITRVIANEFGEFGINANVISPIAYSEGVDQWRKDNPEYYNQVIQGIPLQKFGDVEKDIGPVAVFLGSKDAQYITGQTVMVDGGSIKLY
ncbi:SDR family oxidoreductase [Staphylococcus arlettae]|jgi:NAD(P)-dependent dehydrogenase (short-subunit alcohol dehydrogenase family)|uniref:Diacetyl reductase [(S)-acetoin forming] n=1 Tax=Staphylococcus sp. 693-7 TaxID=678944 RepID=D2JDK7_9STAP|nr:MULTISPECIES: SDR family oxidoreductase [Staphylococcus]ADA62664.1 predicted short chain dehydrogenase [Staphylococcus sp. 693-7]MCD8893013.1 SDR family oxidoreductase [Staphylococcus nepalensis]NKE85556.1 SDR family oxidoreductase [Staphylococcus arlettae]URN38893.1 SDR family oxidoreductase [Staphylococcus arlettae]HJG55122.1 SDR family oxidoreductase [Staphylococcus arlettae]